MDLDHFLLYQKYKYYFIPSFYEGNPKVLIEAMSKGCIVLASNISNHTEIIKNNNNGIIFDLNKGSLKNSLERLDTNIELRKNIALNAYEETNLKFSIDKAAMSEYEDYKLVSGIGS